MNTNNSSFEHSPAVSEDASCSWTQHSDNELTVLPDLHLGPEGSLELSSLVEDKEIAARAVAFVVNSTRKGIVPLCADVANLLRAKRRLEKKVFILKKENDVLHSTSSLSRQTSHSISPTPASFSSEKSNQAEFVFTLPSERNRPCSRCSQCSSTISSSPNFDQNRQRLSSLQYSPASSHGDESIRRRRFSLRGKRSCSESYDALKEQTSSSLVQAEIHEQPRHIDLQLLQGTHSRHSSTSANEDYSENGIVKSPVTTAENDTSKTKLSKRNNSCQEDVWIQRENGGIPNVDGGDDLTKKFLRETLAYFDDDYLTEGKQDNFCKHESNKIMTEMHHDMKEREGGDNFEPPENFDCTDVNFIEKSSVDNLHIDPEKEESLEKKFAKSLILNSKLNDELGAARQEIDFLRRRLQEMEASHCDNNSYDKVFIEDEVKETKMEYLEKKVLIHNNKNSRQTKSLNDRSMKSRLTPISAYLSQPLYGCKCSACETVFSSSEYLSNTERETTEDKRTFSVSHKLKVQLNDHVVAKGDRTGFIRYVGHLDKHGQSNMLFTGLELDSPAGDNDGSLNGKRYFNCAKNHGIFVPLQEIICKGSKKVVKKPQNQYENSKGHRKRKGDRSLLNK